MPVEELTLRTASLANMLEWLAKPQGPHLVDGSSTENPLTALAILISPEALYDSVSPLVGLGLVYKAPYIQTTSWTEAYFDCKQLFTGSCRVGTFYQFPCFAYDFLVFSFRGVRFCLGNICERFARRDLC